MTLWDNLRKQIEEEYKNNSAGFLRQPTIRKCLHPIQKEMVKYLNEIGEHCRYFTDSIYGNPQILVEGKSSVTIQHIYYTWLMKKHWKNISFNNIIDIGAGYGNSCRLWKYLGHSGNYTIADFPEFHNMQKTYLEQTSNIENVKFKTIEDCWDNEGGLLQATFSLNEMPLSDRIYIENNITKYDYIFITHNVEFDGIDNINYFTELGESLKSQGYELAHYNCEIYTKCWFFIARRQ